MKHPIRCLMTVAMAAAVLFSSCKKEDKDPGILPAIAFKTAAGYTFRDTTVTAGTMLLTGIDAHKTESQDVLRVFGISRSYDGGASTTVLTESLTSAQGDTYSKDYAISTRSTAGTEKYTYTVSNRDGLVNVVSLTVTTQ